MTAEPSLDRRIRRTRKAIRLALQHLLAERPFDEITIREIAEVADISYTTFFRHFSDKESVLSDLADDEIGRLLDLALPIFVAENSFASAVALCENVKRNDRLWLALLAGGAAGNVRASFIRQTEQRSENWASKAVWLPAEVGSTILVGITVEVLAWWLGKAPHEPPEKIAGILNRFFSLVSVQR